ncbi:hypothetical protein COOONC_02445 [Cooperia oncophora]
MALENGLYAIVADGVHSLHPKSLGYHAQLYCVHGVCSREVDVPLMFCITEKKTRRVYKKIFEHLKTNLRGETPRRIVLDFEKAAIHAAKMVFPTASVECCAFHSGPGLEPKKGRTHTWEYHRNRFSPTRATAGCTSPAQSSGTLSDHSAYADCQEFLDYLRTIWIDGPFKGLWCKWGLEEVENNQLG